MLPMRATLFFFWMEMGFHEMRDPPYCAYYLGESLFIQDKFCDSPAFDTRRDVGRKFSQQPRLCGHD